MRLDEITKHVFIMGYRGSSKSVYNADNVKSLHFGVLEMIKMKYLMIN